MTHDPNDATLEPSSPKPHDALLHQLQALVPEAFSESRLDVAALKRFLDEESVIEGGERYALTWAGKANAPTRYCRRLPPPRCARSASCQ